MRFCTKKEIAEATDVFKGFERVKTKTGEILVPIFEFNEDVHVCLGKMLKKSKEENKEMHFLTKDNFIGAWLD